MAGPGAGYLSCVSVPNRGSSSADLIPEVAQSRRLGHILGDRIQETYSHVAAEVEHRLLEALNDRWDKAVADSPDQPAWRI